MLLFAHALAHLLVDGVCAAAVFGPLRSQGDLTGLLVLYNTLAFSTQCLVGLWADRIRRLRPAASGAMLCVIMGYFLPLPVLLRVMLLGLGNSVFHVAAGTETLRNSGFRAAPLGIFVAPGALGVTLGTLLPGCGTVLAILLAAAAAGSLLLKADAPRHGIRSETSAETLSRRGVAALLTAAVAVRAVGGSVVSFPWQTGQFFAMLTTAVIFAGKAAGGFLCDRVGPRAAAWVSIPAAAALIAFCEAWLVSSLLGQFALNLTMPVTLLLLYRAMPEAPGFAFGLAASALWPGTLAGKLIAMTGAARWCFLLACFLFGLLAILYAVSRTNGLSGGRLPLNRMNKTEKENPL